MARQSTLTMTAVLSQRGLADVQPLGPMLGEMAVWDPSEDPLGDPAQAFEDADRQVMRILSGISLLGLVPNARVTGSAVFAGLEGQPPRDLITMPSPSRSALPDPGRS